MAQRWSLKEDIIICKYCIENAGICLSDFHLEEMSDRLEAAGCISRSRGALRNRAYIYLILIDGRRWMGVPKNLEYIYNELYVNGVNLDRYHSVKYKIRELYNPDECAGFFDDNNSLLYLAGNAPNDLIGLQRTIDYHSTFPMVLQKYVEQKGIKKHNAMCRKIGMKPDTFSAILRGKYKEVKKDNILKICVGLELRVSEAEELLESAGFSLSNGIMKDVVIKSFLWDRIYSVVAINAELYENNEPMLFQDYIVEYKEF